MPAIRNVAAAVLAMAMLSSQASAQDQPTAEQAMARVLHGALAVDGTVSVDVARPYPGL